MSDDKREPTSLYEFAMQGGKLDPPKPDRRHMYEFSRADIERAMQENAPLQDAIAAAARKMAAREAGAVDDAIAALLAAGVPVGEIEVLLYPWGKSDEPGVAGERLTIVRRRRP